MKVLIVDDHELFREGLKFLLQDLTSDISFLEAGSCASACSLNNAADADIILLDYYLPDTEGLSGIQQLQRTFKQAIIVVLSSEDKPEIIHQAISEGASGFIPKSSSQPVMIAALQLVLAGGIYLPPHVLRSTRPAQLLTNSESETDELGAILSGRQRSVLLSAIRGRPNKEIARELNISEGTVKAHLSSAYRQLGVSNRTEAVFAAAKHGVSIKTH